MRHAHLAALAAALCATSLVLSPGPARAVERELGTGVVRVNGHGAEYWHWEAQKLRRRVRQLERRWRPTSRYAMRLASAAFGVPYRQLERVARCETGGTLSPAAYEPSTGASGLLQFLSSTWRRTPFARFSVFDPVANALAAAQIVAREGWRQWSCG